jgi:hypothetical protein
VLSQPYSWLKFHNFWSICSFFIRFLFIFQTSFSYLSLSMFWYPIDIFYLIYPTFISILSAVPIFWFRVCSEELSFSPRIIFSFGPTICVAISIAASLREDQWLFALADSSSVADWMTEMAFEEVLVVQPSWNLGSYCLLSFFFIVIQAADSIRHKGAGTSALPFLCLYTWSIRSPQSPLQSTPSVAKHKVLLQQSKAGLLLLVI